MMVRGQRHENMTHMSCADIHLWCTYSSSHYIRERECKFHCQKFNCNETYPVAEHSLFLSPPPQYSKVQAGMHSIGRKIKIVIKLQLAS